MALADPLVMEATRLLRRVPLLGSELLFFLEWDFVGNNGTSGDNGVFPCRSGGSWCAVYPGGGGSEAVVRVS